MTSDYRRQLRILLAPALWLSLLVMMALSLLSWAGRPFRVAEAHGTVDQQVLGSLGPFLCSGGCGQTFTPTANNIVAFDMVAIFQELPLPGTFVLRQWPSGPVIAGPFTTPLVLGVNHIDIPGAPVPITPGTKYEVHHTNGLYTSASLSDIYAGGASTFGTPTRSENADLDLYLVTYFQAPLTATVTTTSTSTATRTATAIATVTATATPTSTLVPPLIGQRPPNLGPGFGAIIQGGNPNQAALQGGQPVASAASSQAVGGARDEPAVGGIRPPNTGDAGPAGGGGDRWVAFVGAALAISGLFGGALLIRPSRG